MWMSPRLRAFDREVSTERVGGARTLSITMQARTRHEHNIIQPVSTWACGPGVRAIFGCVLVILVVLCMFLAQRARVAVRERNDAVAARDRSERLVRVMQDSLSRTGNQSNKTFAAQLSSMIDELRSTSGPQPDVTMRLVIAAAQQTAGLLLLRDGDVETAEALLEESYAARVRELGPLDAQVGRSLAALGELALARRDWRGARQHLIDSARVLRAVGIGGAELGLVLLDLGTATSGASDPGESLAALTEGLQLLENQTSSIIILRCGQAYETRGLLRSRRGDHTSAADDFARAVDAKVATLGAGDRGTHATLRAALAHAREHGLHDRAASHLTAMLEGSNISDDERVEVLAQLAEVRSLQRNFEGAEVAAARALALLAGMPSPSDATALRVRTVLMRALIAQREYADAESVMVECMAGAGASAQIYNRNVSLLASAAIELYAAWKKPERELWWRDAGVPSRE